MLAKKIEFEIEGLPKMPNELLGRHWRSRSSHAKKWMTLVALHGNRFKPAQPFASAVLFLKRVSSTEPDHDGLVGSFKSVIDALVKNHFISNDTPAVIGVPEYAWEKGKRGKGKVVIHIEECPPRYWLRELK